MNEDKFLEEQSENLPPNSQWAAAWWEYGYPQRRLAGQEFDFKEVKSFDSVSELLKALVSVDALGVYGSVEELQDLLSEYMSYPGFQERREFAALQHWHNISMFKSLKNEPYILKQDLFVHLQNIISEHHTTIENEIFPTLIAIYLKSLGMRHDLSGELIHASHPDRISLKIDICESLPQVTMPLGSSEMDYETVLNELSSLIPAVEWNAPEYQCILQKLREICLKALKTRRAARKIDTIRSVLWSLKRTIACVEREINARPSIFLPSALCHQKKKSNKEVVLRLFKDNNVLFSLLTEFKSAMGMEQGQNDRLQTIPYQEMQAYLVEHSEMNVEFVVTPIIRDKFRAQPIQIASRKFVKLDTDVFFEALYSAMYGGNFFHDTSKQAMFSFKCWIENWRVYFESKNASVNFLEQEQVSSQLKFPITSKKAWNIEVGPNGFTLQDLERTMESTKLNMTSIMDHVETVFEHVNKEKSGLCLRKCDLMDAVVQLQLIWIMEQFPKIAEHFHRANGCHRLLMRSCCQENDAANLKTIQEMELTTLKEENQQLKNDLAKKNITIRNLQEQLEQAKEAMYLLELQNDHSPDVLNICKRLLELRKWLRTEKPVSKAARYLYRLALATNEGRFLNPASTAYELYKWEMTLFEEEVEKMIETIRGNPGINASELGYLPEKPTLSQVFLKGYKEVLGEDVVI